ncbi:MAG TPA: hypothetical protein VGY52_17155 [Roseiarcus sp.]|jgi:hypothetical protein|nr:hypothetical protein [Roseiarcus sp.]
MISPSRRRAGARGARGAAVAAVAAFALAGCVETAAELSPDADAQHSRLVRRPDVSLAGATVAFVSVDGPPAEVSATFIKDLAREASAQNIVVADSKKARYLVRGYLSAYQTNEGAAVEYVWDVFTKDKLRAQRLNDYIEVKGQGDPWAIAGEAALSSIAAKSADDLAAFLSNTPEAVAGVKAPSGAAALLQPAAGETKALSYAPVD